MTSQVRLHFKTDEAGANLAIDRLGSIYEEQGYTLSTFEIDEVNKVWEVSVYCDASVGNQLSSEIRTTLSNQIPLAEFEIEDLPDIDWVAKSLEGLKPVRADRFLVHGAHDRASIRPNDLAIEIEAGQAFGTGHHGTTAGCLEMIAKVMRRQTVRRALDLGTGSGVLAIAIRKLAPVPTLATDIDPIATTVAASNARANGIVTDLKFETAKGFHSPAFAQNGLFDLIVANILARPLMAMAPDIAQNLAPGGSVILSGILAEQRWKVLAAFNGQQLRHVQTIWRNGWVTIHMM